MYKSPSTSRQASLFWDLETMLDPKHPLFILANMIDWASFEKAFSSLFCADNGRPPKPIRLMTGLLVLKHLRNVSDEQVVGQFSENAYYQYFCGMDAFCYLDGYQDSPDSQPEAYGGYRSLEMVYDFVPDKGIAPSDRKHILGIQGNLWTEYVPTESHAEYMLYPRLLAIAEIGWNGTAEKDLLLSGKNHEAFQKQDFPRTADMFGIHMSHFRGESAG